MHLKFIANFIVEVFLAVFFPSPLPSEWDFLGLSVKTTASFTINAMLYFAVFALFTFRMVWLVNREIEKLSSPRGGTSLLFKTVSAGLVIIFSTQVAWPSLVHLSFFLTCGFYPWAVTAVVIGFIIYEPSDPTVAAHSSANGEYLCTRRSSSTERQYVRQHETEPVGTARQIRANYSSTEIRETPGQAANATAARYATEQEKNELSAKGTPVSHRRLMPLGSSTHLQKTISIKPDKKLRPQLKNTVGETSLEPASGPSVSAPEDSTESGSKSSSLLRRKLFPSELRKPTAKFSDSKTKASLRQEHPCSNRPQNLCLTRSTRSGKIYGPPDYMKSLEKYDHQFAD